MLRKGLGLCSLLSIAVLASVASEAAEISIYRAASGGEALTTVNFDHAWDTTVRSSALHTLSAGNTDIACAAGHHLLFYTARFDRTNTTGNRTEAQSCLVLAGTALPIGYSQGYTRYDTGDIELITSGGGIIDVATPGDLLRLRSYRTDNNGSVTMARAANASGIQLLKLSDAWSYCRLSRSSDQVGPTDAAFMPVVYEVQDELDSADFGHTASSEDITLKTAGHYLVLANTYFSMTSTSSRSGYNQRLSLGDGTTQTYIEGSRTWVYVRGNDSCQDGAAALGMIIETTNANQVLNVEVNKETGADPTIESFGTAVTIVKLPDAGQYVRLDGPADDFNSATQTAQTWDTQNELDPAFSHSGSASTVGVVASDDYLFTTALFDEDDEVDRAKPWQRWRVNGTDVKTYAGMGRYARNSGTANCGNWSGLLVGLTGGDSIEVVSEGLGKIGPLTADHKHLTGVQLGSIFDLGPVTMLNSGESDTTPTSATLNGVLMAEATNATVQAYWGLTDGTNNPTAWDHSAVVGSWTNVTSTNVSHDVTGLNVEGQYYFTFRANYGSTNVWASPSASFTTPISIVNTAESDVTSTSATFNGSLLVGATNADVYVHWGTSDGTNNPAAWDDSALVGSWTNVLSTNVSYEATGLSVETVYYYAFRANYPSGTDVWAGPSVSFSTVGTPAVTNLGGATDVLADRATLHGQLTAGVFADAYFCYGTNDVGTASTSAWANVVPVGVVLQDAPFSTQVSGLGLATEYTYRCYVVNGVGDSWSDADSFTTLAVPTYTWIQGGADSKVWDDPANWFGGAIPPEDQVGASLVFGPLATGVDVGNDGNKVTVGSLSWETSFTWNNFGTYNQQTTTGVFVDSGTSNAATAVVANNATLNAYYVPWTLNSDVELSGSGTLIVRAYNPTGVTGPGGFIVKSGTHLNFVRTHGNDAYLYTGGVTIESGGTVDVTGRNIGMPALGDGLLTIEQGGLLVAYNNTFDQDVRFVINDAGTTAPFISGGGANWNASGTWTFDAPPTGVAVGMTWNIIGIGGGATYDATFNVAGFTENAGVWEGILNGATYQYDESTGVLEALSVGPGGSVLIIR